VLSAQVGDYVDALDSEGHWYDSRIAEVETGPPRKLKIHFMGWDARWDLWKEDGDVEIQPLFSKVRRWREFRASDQVEMKVGGKWYAASVEKVDRDTKRVLLRATGPSAKLVPGVHWFEFWR
jgi:hypothetical protein